MPGLQIIIYILVITAFSGIKITNKKNRIPFSENSIEILNAVSHYLILWYILTNY